MTTPAAPRPHDRDGAVAVERGRRAVADGVREHGNAPHRVPGHGLGKGGPHVPHGGVVAVVEAQGDGDVLEKVEGVGGGGIIEK